MEFEIINFRFEKYEGEKNGEVFIGSGGEISLVSCSTGQNDTEKGDE
jgi:hypothetical protein